MKLLLLHVFVFLVVATLTHVCAEETESHRLMAQMHEMFLKKLNEKGRGFLAYRENDLYYEILDKCNTFDANAGKGAEQKKVIDELVALYGQVKYVSRPVKFLWVVNNMAVLNPFLNEKVFERILNEPHAYPSAVVRIFRELAFKTLYHSALKMRWSIFGDPFNELFKIEYDVNLKTPQSTGFLEKLIRAGKLDSKLTTKDAKKSLLIEFLAEQFPCGQKYSYTYPPP